MATTVAQSLVERYEHVAPYPASREYTNASWALVQLAAWARHIGSVSLERWVTRNVEDNFLDPGDVPGLDDDRYEYEFFSLRGNWLYLIAHTLPRALDRMLEAAALDDKLLAPVQIRGGMHHCGINWSRAWMLHRLAISYPATPLFRDAFDAHVAVALRDHDKIVGDYGYDHWVPQFAVYAITEDAT